MDGYTEPHVQPIKSSSRQNIPRCRNSITSTNEEHPHIGNYRLLKTIGKGNFAKVKLARHVLTGREVSLSKQKIIIIKADTVFHILFGYLYNEYFHFSFTFFFWIKEPHFCMNGYLMFLSLLSLLTCLFWKYNFLEKRPESLLSLRGCFGEELHSSSRFQNQRKTYW